MTEDLTNKVVAWATEIARYAAQLPSTQARDDYLRERRRELTAGAQAEGATPRDAAIVADACVDAARRIMTELLALRARTAGARLAFGKQLERQRPYMALRLSRPDHIANFHAAEILEWDRRRKCLALIKGPGNLAGFSDAVSINEPTAVQNVFRNLADDFECCLPQTSEYFAGLWRCPHKALSLRKPALHLCQTLSAKRAHSIVGQASRQGSNLLDRAERSSPEAA